MGYFLLPTYKITFGGVRKLAKRGHLKCPVCGFDSHLRYYKGIKMLDETENQMKPATRNEIISKEYGKLLQRRHNDREICRAIMIAGMFIADAIENAAKPKT